VMPFDPSSWKHRDGHWAIMPDVWTGGVKERRCV